MNRGRAYLSTLAKDILSLKVSRDLQLCHSLLKYFVPGGGEGEDVLGGGTEFVMTGPVTCHHITVAYNCFGFSDQVAWNWITLRAIPTYLVSVLF